jgi:hypothetical protein
MRRRKAERAMHDVRLAFVTQVAMTLAVGVLFLIGPAGLLSDLTHGIAGFGGLLAAWYAGRAKNGAGNGSEWFLGLAIMVPTMAGASGVLYLMLDVPVSLTLLVICVGGVAALAYGWWQAKSWLVVVRKQESKASEPSEEAP